MAERPRQPPGRASKPEISYRDLAAPTPAKKPFSRPGWIFELKYDGFRALATKEGERVSLVSRKGTNLLPHYPEIGESLKALPDLALDGELLILDGTGRPDFHRLSWRFRLRRPDAIARASVETPAVIFAFDLLWFNDKDLRGDPLRVRKGVLKQVLKDSERIRFTNHIGEEGEKLFAKAQELGLEGIVAKRAVSTYPRGRTSEWLKIKTAHGRHVDEERANWNE